MRARFGGALALLWWATTSIAPIGCTLLNPKTPAGETRVGQGKLYQSDNPTYDDFFEGVHGVQKQTHDAADEEQKARAPLEHALGTRGSAPERLVELTRERVKRGREGPPVRIAVSGLEPPKEGEKPKDIEVSVKVPDEAEVPSNQRELVKALEESAKAEGEVAAKFGSISAKARALLVRHGQLVSSLNRDFTTSTRRQEVSKELDASKPVLTAASDRAEKVANSARTFLKGMAEAFPASGEAPAEPSKEEKPGGGKTHAPPKKNGAPAPHPSKPAPAPPKSTPAPPKPRPEPESKPQAEAPLPPPKPAKPADDFNP